MEGAQPAAFGEPFADIAEAVEPAVLDTIRVTFTVRTAVADSE
jgi:hypothetical protein